MQQKTTDVNQLLSVIAERGLMLALPDDIRAIALEIWYGTSLLDLSQLEGPYRQDAVLLVERLSYYSVVPQPRKTALLGQVRAVTETTLRTSKSVRQEFEVGFKVFLPMLQPLQTRHYEALNR